MKREVVLLIVAIVAGFFAFSLVMKTMNRAPQQIYTEKVQCVIAQLQIPKGQTLTEKDLAYGEPVAKKDAGDLSDFFLQTQDAVGFIAQKDFVTGEKVLRSRVSKEDSSPSDRQETLPIPEGMQALTVPAISIQNLPEFISPGKYVDVMGYQKVRDSEKKEIVNIVTSAQVISLEKTDGGPENARARAGKQNAVESVTLALTPDETKAFLRALDDGPVRLLLRSSKGIKPGYQAAYGTVEIIRGVEHVESVSRNITEKKEPANDSFIDSAKKSLFNVSEEKPKVDKTP